MKTQRKKLLKFLLSVVPLICGTVGYFVLIGFGRLGSELLTWGLQNNIFSPGQRIEYHVFGGDPSYRKIHRELNCLEDAVQFHEIRLLQI